MKKLAAIALVLVLVGCASFSKNLTAEGRYAAARLDLNNLLLSAITYAQYPRCDVARVATCSKQEIVDDLYSALSVADSALDAAYIALTGDNHIDATSQVEIAISTLRQVRMIMERELIDTDS